MSCATPILPSGPLGHVPEMTGHVAEIVGHNPETAGHVRPKYAAKAFSAISASSVFAVVYLAFIATLLGYSLWSRLISRYPASQVAPFSLLVPIIGLASASLLLGEQLSAVQIAGAAFVMMGLVINVSGRWMMQRFRVALSSSADEGG